METLVARQPILDVTRATTGYLIRHRQRPNEPSGDETGAREKLLGDLATLIGIDELTDGGRPAFVTVTRDALVAEHVDVLPPERTVLVVPFEVDPDADILERCRVLCARGFGIGMEASATTVGSPLLDLARWVLVDVRRRRAPINASVVRPLAGSERHLVATRVEDWASFERVTRMGFSHAAGSFFQKPVVIVNRDIPAARLTHLRLLVEINRPEIDIDEIERVVKSEVSIPYKLLRYINSSAIGTRSEVRSIHHALVLMGRRELRRWASLVALTAVAEDGSMETVMEGMLRARFLELLAPEIGLEKRAPELFLAGILSVLDTILERPLETIVGALPIAADIRDAILQRGNDPLGRAYRGALSYVAGDWPAFERFAAESGLRHSVAPSLYVDALAAAHQGAAASRAA